MEREGLFQKSPAKRLELRNAGQVFVRNPCQHLVHRIHRTLEVRLGTLSLPIRFGPGFPLPGRGKLGGVPRRAITRALKADPVAMTASRRTAAATSERWRRDQRADRSSSDGRRARIGSSARNRRKSSPNCWAVA